jgi:hypothetical protein
MWWREVCGVERRFERVTSASERAAEELIL